MNRRLEVLQEADVFVGNEHVDEPTQRAVLVEQPLPESRVLRFETLQHLGHRRSLDRHLGRVVREVPQLRRYSQCRHDYWFSSRSNAAWNASRFGAIVAVGPLVGATASSVFSPWPVM